MAQRIMGQRTNRPNGAHIKQAFVIVEDLFSALFERRAIDDLSGVYS